jgi:hypothetical protein
MFYILSKQILTGTNSAYEKKYISFSDLSIFTGAADGSEL